MNKRNLFTGLIAGLAMTFASAVSAKEYKLATVAPEGSPYGKVMQAWADAVKEKSGGEIDIKIFFSGALGDQTATLRQTQRGRMDGAGVSINALTTVLPEVSLMLEPFIFETDEVRHCVEDNHFEKIFGERFLEAGYVIVGRLDIGAEHFWSKKPIKTLADMEGMKFSVPSTPTYERLLKVAGANPTTLQATEIVPGLKTGQVNAAMASAIYSILIGVPQLTGYAVNPKASSSAGVTGFSKATWESWTPEQQALVQELADEFFPPFRKTVAGIEAHLINKAVEGGLKYDTLSDEVVAELKKRVEESREEFLADMGGTAAEDYAALAAAAAECSK